MSNPDPMKRNRFIFVLAFLLAMSAGAVVGALWVKIPTAVGTVQPPTEPRGSRDREWLSSQLNLRPDQKTQVDAIWNEMHKQMWKGFGERRSLEKERDEACKALLSDEQRAAWDKIRADYKSRIDATNPDREKLVRDAEAKTRLVLDSDQQKRWDELVKQNRERRHGPPGSPGISGGPPSFHNSRSNRSGGNVPSSQSSTTQPSVPGKGQSPSLNTEQPRP